MSALRRIAEKIRLIVADLIGAKIETQDVAALGAGSRRFVLRATAFDSQGDRGMVGVIIGVDSDALGPPNIGPVKFTSGQHDYNLDGTDVGAIYARYIPIVFQTGAAQMFAGPPTARFCTMVMPHLDLFADAGENVVIGDNIGLFLEGAPDVGGGGQGITVTGRTFGLLVNDSIGTNDSLYLGASPGAPTSAFINWGPVGSAGAGAAPADEARFGWDAGATHGYPIVSMDGSQYRPTPAAFGSADSTNFASATYPAGVTVLKSIKPPTKTSGGFWGFASFIPAAWQLPPAIVVAGGQLNPGVNFVFSTGSNSIDYNTDPASGGTGSWGSGKTRDFKDFPVVAPGSYISEIQYVVNNTAGGDRTSALDYFWMLANMI